jgi:mycothiol synthase
VSGDGTAVVVGATTVSAADGDQILDLDSEAAEADGVAALDDQVRLDLTTPGGKAEHLIAREPGGDEIVGYAHADLRADEAVSAHLIVRPSRRCRGTGSALLRGLTEVSGGKPLRVWAHGNGPGARAMAASTGFVPVRELRQMRRDLSAPMATPSYAPGVVVREYVAGSDDEAWVQVNAAAFRTHPEQGRLDVDDLRQRTAQPWFDPAGFFLAERDGHLIGYHWTKIHPTGGSDGGPIGEVYVLGVLPEAQGLGLGKALTLTGLAFLRDSGLHEVMLYVESDNLPAVAVYERLGFTTVSVDVMYAGPSKSLAGTA